MAGHVSVFLCTDIRSVEFSGADTYNVVNLPNLPELYCSKSALFCLLEVSTRQINHLYFYSVLRLILDALVFVYLGKSLNLKKDNLIL